MRAKTVKIEPPGEFVGLVLRWRKRGIALAVIVGARYSHAPSGRKRRPFGVAVCYLDERVETSGLVTRAERFGH